MAKIIIKSLSRKRPSFQQLYDYMKTGSNQKEINISRNVTYLENRNQILSQFQSNYNLLKARKDGNALYHDILSLEHDKTVPISRQKEILTDVARKYLELRAEDNISIGYIHEETNNLHCHLMISSNKKHEKNRHRLSKQELSNIQKQIEAYKIEKFPELGNEKLYTRERIKQKSYQKTYQTSQAKDRENKLKHRTKQPSRNDYLRQIVAECISNSYSRAELIKKLTKHNLEFYQRGETVGIIDLQEKSKGETKSKHRLKTLGFETQYQNLLEFEKSREKEIGKIREIQGANREVEREIEKELG